jgi:hypothetical protein
MARSFCSLHVHCPTSGSSKVAANCGWAMSLTLESDKLEKSFAFVDCHDLLFIIALIFNTMCYIIIIGTFQK